LWGAICAAGALIALTSIGVTAIIAGLCVGISIFFLLLAARLPFLSAIPSAVYGYAATAALFLLGAAAYGEGPAGIVKVAAAVGGSLIIRKPPGHTSAQGTR